MMEKNKKVPAIRFKGFVEEWEEIQVKDIGNVITGSTPSKNEPLFWGGDFIWVTAQDLKNKYINDSILKLTVQGKKVSRVIPKNSVIVTCIASIGLNGINNKECATNQQINSVICNENYYYEYVYYAFEHRTNLLRGIAGQTAVPIINKSTFEEFQISSPINKIEQTVIGNYFQNIDKLIEANQTKLDKLKNIKKACLEKMFPRKGATIPEIRFKGFTEEWEEKRLGEIGDTFTGLSGKTKEDFGHGDAEFVTYMNVFTNPITIRSGTESVEIDNKQNQVQYGDIFFTTSSETPEEVGMSSIWLNSVENVYLNSFCFGYRLNIKVGFYYLAYLLRCPSIRKKITFLAQGISRYNVSKNKMMEIKLPFPNTGEQEKIGTFFKNLDNLISKNEQQLEKLRNIKKACLEKMFVNNTDAL